MILFSVSYIGGLFCLFYFGKFFSVGIFNVSASSNTFWCGLLLYVMFKLCLFVCFIVIVCVFVNCKIFDFVFVFFFLFVASFSFVCTYSANSARRFRRSVFSIGFVLYMIFFISFFVIVGVIFCLCFVVV